MGGLPARETVYGFAVHPESPASMYAAMGKGLFKTEDGGRTWATVSAGLENLVGLAIHPERPEEVYVVTREGAVYQSPDAGKTWRRQK